MGEEFGHWDNKRQPKEVQQTNSSSQQMCCWVERTGGGGEKRKQIGMGQGQPKWANKRAEWAEWAEWASRAAETDVLMGAHRALSQPM